MNISGRSGSSFRYGFPASDGEVSSGNLRPQSTFTQGASELQGVFSDLLNTAIDRLGVLGGKADDVAPAELDGYFNEASRVYGVEKQLLLAVARTESNFKPTATSGSGAMGIMQLMPETAKYLNVEDPYDPYQNIMGGAKLLAMLMDKYDGDKAKSLAAYNAGGNRVDAYGGVPNEIWGYVNTVMGYYREGIGVPDQVISAGTSKEQVAQNLKTEFAKFPEHQSYEMFLRELTVEIQGDETPSDADAAYRMLLGNARTAIDRVRSRIEAGNGYLGDEDEDFDIDDIDDEDEDEDFDVDDIDDIDDDDEDIEDYDDEDDEDYDDYDDYDDEDE